MTDFSLPLSIIPGVKKQKKTKKKEFVDKLKGKRVKVIPTISVGVTFTVCNTATQDVFQVSKMAENSWAIWGSIAYPMLTDAELEDVLWETYLLSDQEEADIRITDEFGCLVWML